MASVIGQTVYGEAMNFQPNISKIEKIDSRPYMVECAFDYYSMAVKSNHQRMGLQTVMCALSIEILLKSFLATVADNQGKLNETYKFDKKALVEAGALPKKSDVHDLIVLYEALPVDIQTYLFEYSEVEILKANRKLFTQSRYVYEPTANTINNDDIIKLSARLVCKIVYLYKSQGCSDPFIVGFDIDDLYFSHVQPYAFFEAL